MTLQIGCDIGDGVTWYALSGIIRSSEPGIVIPVSTVDQLTDEDIATSVREMVEHAWFASAASLANNIISQKRQEKNIDRWRQATHYCVMRNPESLPLLERFKGQDAEIDEVLQCVYDVQKAIDEKERSKVARKRTRRIGYEARKDIQARYDQLFVKLGRRDSFSCAHCDDTGSDLQIDHIHPVSKGGGNDLNNLQLLCPACNLAKGAKVDGED